MLTDAQCRTAKPRPDSYKLPDGKGLYLEVKPNGVKAWRYRFKLARQGAVRESMFAIGEYATAPHGETPEEVGFRGLIEAPIRAHKCRVAWKDVAVFHYQPRGDEHGAEYPA